MTSSYVNLLERRKVFRWRKMLNSTGLVWIYSCLSVTWKRSIWCNWNVSPAVKFAGQHKVPSHVRSQLSHTCHSLTNDSWLSFFFKCNLMRHSSKRIEWLVHVDTTQLDLNREFKLFSVQLPHAGNSGETIYEVKPLEQPSQETGNFRQKRWWEGREISCLWLFIPNLFCVRCP